MKILVTGGTGFCGSHIAKNLSDLGHDVCVTGTQTEHDLNLRILNHHLTGINWSLLKNIDVVFHQAANNDTLFEDKEEYEKCAIIKNRMEQVNKILRKGK